MEVAGLRADIAMQKTARALAALKGRRAVAAEDVREAAQLVLPHRRRRQPLEKPGLDPRLLDDLLPPGASAPSNSGERQGSTADPSHAGRADQDGPSSCDNEPAADPRQQTAAAVTFTAAPMGPIPPIHLASLPSGAVPRPGRRNQGASARSGRFVRAVPDPAPTDWAVGATLRSAALHASGDDGSLTIQPADLHRQERMGETGTLLLFIVDASGSMAARRRMEAVKGAVLSLLVDAHQQRDRVGVIAFRGPRAEVLLPPTDNVELARPALEQLPTGGRTPLAHALALAAETVRSQRRATPDLPVLAIVLPDGQANVALPGDDGDPWEQVVGAASVLAHEEVAALVLDTDEAFVRVGRAQELAGALGGEYRPLDRLTADSLALEVRQRSRWPRRVDQGRRAVP